MDRRVERKVKALERDGAQCWIENAVPLPDGVLDDVVLCDPATLKHPPEAIVHRGWGAFVRSGGERKRNAVGAAAQNESEPFWPPRWLPQAAVGGVLVALGALGICLIRRGDRESPG